jgi:gliding motility-associated-like protein
LGTGNNPNNLCAGSYTCTVADSNNCTASVTVSISEPQAISVSIPTVAVICIGQVATLTANALGGSSGYVYTWTGGTNTNGTATVTASPIVATTYTVSVTDANNCTAGTATVIVNLNSALSVTTSNDLSQCNGTTGALSASASGGNGVYTYAWSSGTTPAVGSNVSATPSTTTVYTVTVTDGCGTPAASDSVMITVFPLPQLSITATSQNGCVPLCVGFSLNSNPAANAVSWQFTSGQSSSNTSATTVCFQTAGSFGATVNVTDINGCQNSFTDNALVTVNPLPEPEFTFDPSEPTNASPIVSFFDLSTGPAAIDWLWSFGDPASSTSTIQQPVFDFGASGTYSVMLVTTTSAGCIDSIVHVVVIEPEFSLYVPNAFTPNRDNKNDVFLPKGVGIMSSDYHMYIFDRWGNQIFKSDDWSNGWDGKVKDGSTTVESDVYVWKIELRMWDGTDKAYVGHVTVVK